MTGDTKHQVLLRIDFTNTLGFNNLLIISSLHSDIKSTTISRPYPKTKKINPTKGTFLTDDARNGIAPCAVSVLGPFSVTYQRHVVSAQSSVGFKLFQNFGNLNSHVHTPASFFNSHHFVYIELQIYSWFFEI